MSALDRLINVYAGFGIHHKHLFNGQILDEAAAELAALRAVAEAAGEAFDSCVLYDDICDCCMNWCQHDGDHHHRDDYGNGELCQAKKLAAALEEYKAAR